MKRKWYVGADRDGDRHVFYSCFTPTEATHGSLYRYVVGPFVTKRGALWAMSHPRGYVHVNEAEYYAKRADF